MDYANAITGRQDKMTEKLKFGYVNLLEVLTPKQKFENLFSRLRGEKEQEPESSSVGLYELHRLPSSKQWYLKFENTAGKNYPCLEN